MASLKCIRENNTINIYDESGLAFICKQYNKIIRYGWNVYNTNGELVLNYNLYDSYYAYFKGIKNICSVTFENGSNFILTSKITWKSLRPSTEFSASGLQGIIYTMLFEHLSNDPLVIRNTNDAIVATLEYSGFLEFEHTYDIEFDNIASDVLIGIYLLLEMNTPGSLFASGKFN